MTFTWMHAFSRHQVQLTKGRDAVAFRLLSPQLRKMDVTVDSSNLHPILDYRRIWYGSRMMHGTANEMHART